MTDHTVRPRALGHALGEHVELGTQRVRIVDIARKRVLRADRFRFRIGNDGAIVEPAGILDAGNSGTTTRLTSGVLAGAPITAFLDGDGSLRRRPMGRIVEPLRVMGARIEGRQGATLLPLAITGRAPLHALRHETSVPSAQVKSCVLLAGLAAEGTTTVSEAVATWIMAPAGSGT